MIVRRLSNQLSNYLEAKMSNKVPKIRFNGYSDAWVQRKFGDIYHKVNERNNGQFDNTRWISVAKMYFQNPEKVTSNNIDTRTYVMRKGDIAFEGHPNNEFKFGRFVENDIGDGVVSELFPLYRPSVEYDINYWKYAIHIERIWGPMFAKSITSSGNSSNKIESPHLERQLVAVPSIDEQRKIGAFLKKLDSLIAANQRKLDLLKEQKKGYLQKMFPKNRAKVPELRFAGFADDWEERKLGEFVIDYVEKTTTQNQFPVLTSSQQQGIVLQETYFANRQVTTDNNIGYYVLPRGYFTFRNRSDNDVFIFNRNDLIDKGIISYFYPVFTLKNSDSDFFLKRINNGIKRQVSIQAEGTGQRVLSMKKFKNIISMFPSLEEQEKIGSFFKQLDETIALHQRKLDLLKEQKKGFLQKMFV